MLKDVLKDVTESDEITSVTMRNVKSGKEITIAKRGKGYVLKHGGEEVVHLESKPDGTFKPMKVPGRSYQNDPWDCYEKCMANCSGLLCAKLCGEKCGVY